MDDERKKVGGFCCPVPPVPLESASVARCGPNRAFVLVTQSVRTSLRGNRERLVIVGTCGFERFYGASQAGQKQRFSTHVDPGSAPSETAAAARAVCWWSRRVLPPGPLRLLHAAIYRHSRPKPAAPYIGESRLNVK